MYAPAIWPARVNSILMNFPKREELLFRTVCAFPNASRIGFARKICSERFESCRPPDFALGVSEVATAARYCMTFFVFSVLPAPDSPLHTVVSHLLNFGYLIIRTSPRYFGLLLHLRDFGKPHRPLQKYVALFLPDSSHGTYWYTPLSKSGGDSMGLPSLRTGRNMSRN